MVLASVIAGIAISTQQSFPNIIYIMADDLGYGELGCFGQKKIKTPHIDQMAKDGMRLLRYYAASPVCAPTRCSLLTGKHQGNAEIRGNKERGGFGPNDAEGQFPLPMGEITVAEILKSRGYDTAIVGKWGLGGPQPGEHPLDHGFDHFYGYLCQRRAHNFYPTYLWNDHQPDLLLGNRTFNAHQRIPEPLKTSADYDERFGGGDYSAQKICEDAVKFISKKRNKPFFLYYASTLPHAALQAPREWIEKYPKEWDEKPYLGQQGYLPTDRPRATYAAMISYLDFTVGEIVKSLQKIGAENNTLIIFTSDNGATFNGGVDREFFGSNGGLRDGKMSLHEGGIRVPFVAKWPGQIAPNSENGTPLACYDFLATVCEAIGAKTPGNTNGISFLPVLRGKNAKSRPYLYFEYPEATSQQAVIWGDFKAIYPTLKTAPNQVQIYNLISDPGETNDLSKDRPELVAEAERIRKKEHKFNKHFLLPGIDPK